MSVTKRIVCLANSRKRQGRCLAGRELTDGQPGGWIRPVSNRPNEEVSEFERQYQDGSDPGLLEIIDDKNCYENDCVQYRRVASTETFRSGIERILAGAHHFRIALMCAEREPLECHRTLLVAPELEKAGVHVIHILADGSTESHSGAMSRLLRLHKMAEADLFRSRSELIEEACYRQQERVGFVEKPPSSEAGQAAR